MREDEFQSGAGSSKRPKRFAVRAYDPSWGAFSLMLFLLGGALLWATRPAPLDMRHSQEVQNNVNCQANMSRIARAFAQYAQDYDGKFPRGVDPEDRYNPTLWQNDETGGVYRRDAATAPMLHDLLAVYLPDRAVWKCPSDRGYTKSRLPGFNTSLQNVFPSSFQKYGTSYYYFTIHGFAGMRAAELRVPGIEILLFDGDLWHAPEGRPSLNVLFADGHVANVSPQRFQELENQNQRNR